MSWSKVKLGDVASVTSSKRIFAHQYVDDGVPFYRQKEIIERNNKQDVSEPLFISQDLYDEIEKKYGVPSEGDLLITGVGVTLGIPYVVGKEIFYFKDGNLIWLKNFKPTVSSKFIYYFISSEKGQKAIWSRVIGAAQPALTIDIVKQYELEMPDFKTQKRIADILSAYDNLIENNQKQIKLLEEAAQRLYKEWFIDLRFPGYEDVPVVDGVPVGWKQCPLGEVIAFNPKVSLTKDRIKQSVPMSALSTSSMILNSAEFTETASNSGSKFQNGDTLLARITPCLENGKTAYVWGLKSEEGAVGSTEFIVMRSVQLSSYMVYLLARTNDFRQTAINSMTGSDGRQRAQVDKLKGYLYLLPPDTVVTAFGDMVAPVFEAINKKNELISRLAQARDRLLPKLMSGELEV